MMNKISSPDHVGILIPLENLELFCSRTDESDADLLPFFEEEANEELKKIEKILHALHSGTALNPLKELKVRFHTIKGAANSIGQLRIGSLATGMHDTLELLKPNQLDILRQDVTKTCVLLLEAMKTLLQEAHAPQYNKARSDMIKSTAQSIFQLRILIEKS